MARFLAVLILASFTASQIVGAAPGPSSSEGNFDNVKDTEGLCVPEHREKPYYKMGHCKTVYESLIYQEAPKNCVNQKLEEVRKKLLGQYQAPANQNNVPGTNQPPASTVSSSSFSCTNSHTGKSIQDYAKDQKMFAYLLLQLGSAITIGESKWDVKNDGRGLTGITRQQMDDPKYACGCDITNSKSRGGTPAGESPGERDGHHSLQCAIYILLHHASEDGYLFSGERPKPGEKPDYKGGARVFESLRSHGYEQAPDGSSREKNPKLRFIVDKLNNWCDKAGFTQKWTPELMPDTDMGGMR